MEAKPGLLQVKQGELSFECAGEGDAVVFLHGFGLDSRMRALQFEAFQSAFRVIRYDLRGFGRSSVPPVCQYAHEDDLQALLLHLGVTSAHVVGLSMGGRMALRFAVAYPKMVQSLVLADSALDGYAWSDDWQRRWKGMCEYAKAGRIAEAKRQWLEHPLFGSARTLPSCALLLATMIAEYSGWHWQGKDSARTPSHAMSERLHEICSPSLVITGARDVPDFQAIGNRLAGGLPRAHREIIESSGYMVNLEAQIFSTGFFCDSGGDSREHNTLPKSRRTLGTSVPLGLDSGEPRDSRAHPPSRAARLDTRTNIKSSLNRFAHRKCRQKEFS